MNPLSDRINNLAVSQTLAMAALARELKAQGKDIISLSLGEPDFNTPEFIKEAAKKAIDENYSTYTPVEGYLELKEAISRSGHLTSICGKYEGMSIEEGRKIMSTPSAPRYSSMDDLKAALEE